MEYAESIFLPIPRWRYGPAYYGTKWEAIA